MAVPPALTLLALAVLATGVRAEATAAERSGYALDWQRGPGAESCIASDELASRLAELAGPVLGTTDHAERVIAGVIARDPVSARFTVSVRLLDRAGQVLGERSFTSVAEACAALTESILLVTAILSDTPTQPSAAQPEPTPSPLTSGQLSATPAFRREAGIEHAMLERARMMREPWDLALLGSGSLGVQPRPGPGVGVLLRLDGPQPVAFEVSAHYWFTSTVAIDRPVIRGPESSDTVDFELLSATLSACLPLLRLAHARLDSCFGAVVGARWLTSPALADLREGPRPLVGPAIGLDLRYAVSPDWFLLTVAQASTMLPLASYRYRATDNDERVAFDPAPIAGSLAVGIGLSTR